MTPEQKAWIDSASYETLLKRWRFSAGDEMFQGECGQYYASVIWAKRDALPPEEQVAISKHIGWEKK